MRYPRISLLIICSLTLLLSSCGQKKEANPISSYKIAFGSCGHENHPLPVFEEVIKQNPDLFIFLGDNIYGDTYDMDTLRAKYARLGSKSSYQNLKQQVPIIATWDDHDYGWNDAGRHYPHKAAAKEIFMDFFDEPADSERRNREGIHQSYYIEKEGKTIQIILLDNRTFRDDLQKYNGEVADDPRYFYRLDYAKYTTADSTLLGAKQWEWLEGELQKAADYRIIGSSTQFSIEYNGYEAWANFPHERQKMLELIKKHQVEHLLFLSGDVHYAEISKLEASGLYPIYDLTSSGLSSTWHFATPNKNRIEGPIMDNHFGLLTIELEGENPVLKAEVWDVSGNQRIEYVIPASELTF